MRRRLDLAVSLIAAPPVLFLDEPTTGLDPRSRAELWDVLRGLVADGTTLLLTTQYLEEADQLCRRHRRHRPAAGSSPQGTPTAAQGPGRTGQRGLTVAATADLAEAERLRARRAPARCTSTTAARRLTAPADGLRDMTRIGRRVRRAPGSTSTTSA